MAIQKLLLWPNQLLKLVSEEVDEEWARSDDAKKLVKDMTDTLLHFGGVGLSAIQIGYQARLFVMRTKESDKWVVTPFFNPVLVSTDGEEIEVDEGCLSMPGIVEKAKRFPEIILECDKLVEQTRDIPIAPGDNVAQARETDLMPNGSGDEVARQVEYFDPEKVTVSITTKTFERVKFSLEGVEAQCAQHELEHLDGKTMGDSWGPVKRDIVKRKIRKNLKMFNRYIAYQESHQ